MHKTRWELKNCRTLSTCWLQVWFKFAGSKSSIWQLFCYIQALAPVLFQHVSLIGAAEAVRAVIWLGQHWYHLLRATKWNYRLVHHAANLQAAQGLTGTQLELTRHMALLFFPRVTSPSDSWLSLQPSLATQVLCPRQGYHLRSLRDCQSPGGQSSMSSRDGGRTLFC